jgi:hypothetical protein
MIQDALESVQRFPSAGLSPGCGSRGIYLFREQCFRS